MISHRMRENRRLRALKLPKTIERLYRENKCRDCAVVVTRMDFAKILGKFTKVKIQYESSSPKTKKTTEVTSPNSNARLKSNENGMVLIRRSAYNQHPVKELQSSVKKPKANPNQATPRQASNVLKENNRLKKTPLVKDKNSNISISSSNVSKRQNNARTKQYGIIFIDPSNKKKNDIKSKITLASLVSSLDKSILPTEDWCIDYLPRSEEPMDDKVYDRIAAELEDLMYNEPIKPEDKPSATDNNDFPSIMDILNDNTNQSKPNDQSTSVEFKASLESSDVEAMLLGKTSTTSKELAPMEVDNTDMSNLIEDVAQLNEVAGPIVSIPEIPQPVIEGFDNPHSPSILDEALQKGIEEHLPCNPPQEEEVVNTEKPAPSNPTTTENSENVKEISESPTKSNVSLKTPIKPVQKFSIPSNITHLIFRKSVEGRCLKSVTCPKNLKYIIELDGKTVEFLGAPKVISSLEDLEVLLQIVNETELQNLYVCH